MALTESDLIELNSYLDGVLNEAERRSFEQRLAADADLRAELDSLRATVALLRQAPRLRVPRNFTLDPATYARPAKRGLFGGWGLGGMRTLAGAASLVTSLLLFAGALLTRLPLGGMAPSVAEMPMAAESQDVQMLEFAAEEPAAEEPAAEEPVEAPAPAAIPEDQTRAAEPQATPDSATKLPETPTPDIAGAALAPQGTAAPEVGIAAAPTETAADAAGAQGMGGEPAIDATVDAIAQANAAAGEEGESGDPFSAPAETATVIERQPDPWPWLVGFGVFFAILGVGFFLVRPTRQDV